MIEMHYKIYGLQKDFFNCFLVVYDYECYYNVSLLAADDETQITPTGEGRGCGEEDRGRQGAIKTEGGEAVKRGRERGYEVGKMRS